MESSAIIQELIQVHREVTSNIQLGGCFRNFRLWRSVGSRKGREGTILITNRTRKGNKVREVHLPANTSSITPVRIHIRKTQVVKPERTFQIISRSRGIRNNDKANPVNARDRGITHQANLFFAISTQVLFHRIDVRRTTATLQVREIRNIHGEGVVQPVFFMAILNARAAS